MNSPKNSKPKSLNNTKPYVSPFFGDNGNRVTWEANFKIPEDCYLFILSDDKQDFYCLFKKDVKDIKEYYEAAKWFVAH